MAPNGLKKNRKKHKAASAGVNGSKWAQKTEKKNRAAGAGGNWGPLESENNLEGVNFFFEIDPDPGVPYA